MLHFNQMKLLALLLLSSSLFAATLTIDCGSATDQYFTGGTAYTIAGAAGDATLRYGSFAYNIPATGPQVVRLVFRETGTVSAANQRIFSVKFNEETVIGSFDLFAGYGLNATERVFVRMPSDGIINISFSYSKKSALISEIDVTPLWDLLPPAPVVTPPPVATNFPAIAEWAKCQSGVVLAGPIGAGVPPGSMWPGLRKVGDVNSGIFNPDSYLHYSCDGLEYYKFKLADGTITGPFVAVRMPDEFGPDPVLWVKQ